MTNDNDDIRKMREQRKDLEHLCREDFIDAGDVTLTLAEAGPGLGAVVKGKARLPFEAEDKPAIKLCFVETPKKLVLNKTNEKELRWRFGNKTKQWVGKKITLYLDPKARGVRDGKGGIRIKQETKGEK